MLIKILTFNARLRQILFPLIEEIEITLRCNLKPEDKKAIAKGHYDIGYTYFEVGFIAYLMLEIYVLIMVIS